MDNEFQRFGNLEVLAKTGKVEKLVAEADERKALAIRAGIPAVKALEANLTVIREGNGIYTVEGVLRGELTLACSRTLAPIPQKISEDIAEGYIEHSKLERMEEEDQAQYDDYEIFEGEEVDLGEMIAQIMILSIDPYPVLEGDNPEKGDTPGVTIMSEEDAKAAASPFATLKKLQKKG